MHHEPDSDWQKIAALLECWKRFPPDPEEQVLRILSLFSSLSSPDAVKAAAWLLSRDLRSKLVDLDALIELVSRRNQLPLWLIHYALEINTDKAEAMAALDAAPGLVAAEPLELLKTVTLLKKMDAKSEVIAAVWDKCQLRGRWLFNKIILGNYTTPIPPIIVYKAISHFLGCTVHPISAAIQIWDPFTQPLDFLAGGENKAGRAAFLPVLPDIHTVEPAVLAGERYRGVGLLFPPGLQRGVLHYQRDVVHLNSEEGALLASFPASKKAQFPEVYADVFYKLGAGKKAKVENIWLHDLPELYAYQNLPWSKRQSVLNELKEVLGEPLFYLMPESLSVSFDVPNEPVSVQKEVLLKEGFTSPAYAVVVKPAKRLAKAMVVYVKRSALDPSVWDEVTLGMRHPDHPELVPVARWQPPAVWPHWEEWQKGIKKLYGERFGPVTTIQVGWLVEIEFEHIQASRKHKSGFFIPNVGIRSWLSTDSKADVDDVMTLYEAG